MHYFKTLGILMAALAALIVLPSTSYAQQTAYTSKNVNLRAGPSRDYPIVAIVQPAVAVTVVGCVSDYRWCDVVAGGNRGWLYAGNIVYPYQGRNVTVLSYGAVIGIGIVIFNLGPYWDQHYPHRPWFPQRQRWIDRPPPAFDPGSHRRPPHGPGFGHGGNQHPRQGPHPDFGPRPPHNPGPGNDQRPQRGHGPAGARNR